LVIGIGTKRVGLVWLAVVAGAGCAMKEGKSKDSIMTDEGA